MKDTQVRNTKVTKLYNLVGYMAVPYILTRLLWRSRKSPAYKERWAERFGHIKVPEEMQNGIWIHAVSVGEVLAAVPLVKQLQKDYPNKPMVITTTTPTGSERVRAAFKEDVFHVYLPYDLQKSVKRFVDRVKPKVAIIMETEIWPNLFASCKQQNIPIIIANARLAEKSFNGYKKFSKLIEKTLANVAHVAAQSNDDADRYKKLGLSEKNVSVIGNIKFDITIPKELNQQAEGLKASWGEKRPTLIAASTHKGEEEQVLEAFQIIKKSIPDILLILVPRHPERFNTVKMLCEIKGYQVTTRTSGENCTINTDVFLGDTMGELLLFYAASDVAFVGGSLSPIGGHNLLEPAALKLPIITGPHTFNFTEITNLMNKHDAITIIKSPDEFAEAAIAFLSNPDSRERVGQNAQEIVYNNKGALKRHVALINEFLPIE